MKRSQQNKLYITVIIAIVLLIAAFFTWYLLAGRANTAKDSADTSQSANTNDLALLTGEAYDELFIANMLAHHEGAVNMAEMVGAGTERQELRDFAQQIIIAQSSEIASMRQWQSDWNFDPTAGGHGIHAGMAANDMAGQMMDMGESLTGLTGAEFEKQFLTLMIEHHEQAIDMARSAETNAGRQEIKDLAREIINAQDGEIAQMKQWLVDWGYATQ